MTARRKAPRKRSFRLQRPTPGESVVQSSVLTFLDLDPRVGLICRVNVGLLKNPRDPSAWVGWSVRGVDGKPAKGFPDIMCVIKPAGRLCFMECKRKGAKLSDDQGLFRDAAHACGAVHAVVTSIDDAALVLRLNTAPRYESCT